MESGLATKEAWIKVTKSGTFKNAWIVKKFIKRLRDSAIDDVNKDMNEQEFFKINSSW